MVLARRILVRALVGLRHNRGPWIAGLLVTTGLAIYVSLSSLTGGPLVQVAGAEAAITGDCADVTIRAATSGTTELARQAYRCLAPSVARNTSEAEFVHQAQQSAPGHNGHLTRVGDYRAPDGGKVVFYAFQARSTSVGYIVYLDPQGKVWRLE